MPRSRSIASSFVVLVLLGLSIAMFIYLNVDSMATRFVQDKLTAGFAGSEFSATVERAVFVRGEGFELRGVRLFAISAADSPPLLQVDSALLSMPMNYEDVVAFDLRPQAIELHRARVQLSETDLTSGKLVRLASALQRLRSGRELIPVTIHDATIQYARQSTDAKLDRLAQLTDIEISLTPRATEQTQLMELDVAAGGNTIRRLQAQGLVDLSNGQWQLKLDQVAGTLNNALLSMLPFAAEQLQSRGCNLRGIQGELAVRGTVAGNLNSPTVPGFQIDGTISDLSLRNDTIPLPLHDCQATFSIDNTGLHVKRAVGQLGIGKFDVAWRQQGFPLPLDWEASGSLEHMQWDHRTLAFFPELCQKFCNEFSPAGTFDVRFALDSSGHKDITGQLTDMSFSWYRFPFQANHCVGNIRWLDDELEFKVQSLEQQQLLEFDGRINNPGVDATYVFNFGTDGRLPIDEKLLNALQKFPSMDKAFRDLQPVGTVSGRGSVKKLTPRAEIVQKDVEIRLHSCSVRHRSFNYPMHNVNGTIRVTHDGLIFEEITGSNSSGQSQCNGLWNKREGLRLNFICNAVQLNDQLRTALTPQLQELWDGMRPGGRIKLGRVFVNYLPGSTGLDVRVQANLGEPGLPVHQQAVHIHPVWFPYRIDQLQGNIEIGGGKITLDRIQGKHGKTWLTCAGVGSYSNSRWSVSLQNLLAGSVRPDEELLQAFPVDLARAIENLDFRGQVNVSGDITFFGDYAQSPALDDIDYSSIQQVSYASREDESPQLNANVDWDLRLDMDQAKMLVGLPLEDMFGFVNLAGHYDGKRAQCRGQIALESLTVHDVQIRNVNGPIWIDDQQTLVGKFVQSTESQPQSLVGEVFEGQLVLDGWVSHEESWPFFVQTTIENSALEEAAAELAPQLAEVSGDGFGFLRLRGNANDLHSFSGNGNIHLRNAKIHQLPVILSLLKILSIKEVTRTAFDSSDVDFTIKGDQIQLERIELIGDAISLIGNGYLELMRYADINFYSVVGRNRLYIPLVSELYRAGSQRIMWINIAGPMDNLATTRKVLPGLNDSIKTLFQSGGEAPGQESFSDRTADRN